MPEITREVLPFVQNYGQAIRCLKHIDPDDAFSHIYTFEEYNNVDSRSMKKSFWVLGKGHSYIDLYKALLAKIALGQFAFNVHDVSVNQRGAIKI